ncbi:MAG: glycosyltransferase family 4 protein [Dehalococcoidia bacterium]
MRIGMIAPLELSVPPRAYGGIELVVGVLVDGLIDRGHEVTLFASGDSITAAHLVSVFPHSLRGTDRYRGPLNLLNVAACLEQAGRFDIIHNHTEFEGLALAGLSTTPVLTTFHGAPNRDCLTVFAHYQGWYNAISQAAGSLLPPKERCVGVVYNAIDVSSYPFNDAHRRGAHLLFLSRMSEEKGPHLAIEVARRLQRPLVLAGNVDSNDEEFFNTQVLPHVDDDLIQYVGEADYHQKRDLLSRAHCLLAPITWPEPFGLFMIEAMACGTPVVAFNRGAVPELVQHGETGYVVNDIEEMAQAVDEVDHIDREQCRSHVQRYFDAHRMVDDYIAAYEYVVSAESGAATQVPSVGLAGRA